MGKRRNTFDRTGQGSEQQGRGPGRAASRIPRLSRSALRLLLSEGGIPGLVRSVAACARKSGQAGQAAWIGTPEGDAAVCPRTAHVTSLFPSLVPLAETFATSLISLRDEEVGGWPTDRDA